MAGYDFRTKPEAEGTLSFFIFDNLNLQDSGEGGNVYRFDTMQEAIVGWRMLTAQHPQWVVALGGSVAGEREIDFVHHRDGWMNVLVDDYKRIPLWANRDDVAQAIKKFAEGPGIEWQTDRELLGGPVFIPYAPEGASEDPVLADKALLPKTPESPLTSVSEAYVQGQGWVGFDQLKQLIRDHGSNPDARPRVSRLNVAYETMGKDGGERGRTGYVDIKPHEMYGMAERFRELMDIREQELVDQLAAETRVGQAAPAGKLPDTGKPFFVYDSGYGEEQVNLSIGTYHDDNIYVGFDFYDSDIGGMDFYGDVTVNIIKLPPFLACVDTNNNGEKVVDFLVKNGFGEPTGGALPSGFCMYPVFRFNEEKLREADPRGFEQHCKEAGIKLESRQQETAKDSLDEAKKQARERARERNAERPKEITARSNAEMDL